jgi:hypothetical protein
MGFPGWPIVAHAGLAHSQPSGRSDNAIRAGLYLCDQFGGKFGLHESIYGNAKFSGSIRNMRSQNRFQYQA